MDIPFTSTPRPDTGFYNAKLGVWLFLASEVMLFGGLFSAYVFLRTASHDWPRGAELLDVKLATLNTVILLASSLTMRSSWKASVARNLERFRWYMLGTIFLGLAFLCCKALEYKAKIGQGLLPSVNTFLAVYFTLTGIHALHVLAGLSLNVYLVGSGARMLRSNPARFSNRVQVAGVYWNFVDLVWVAIFMTLYLF